MVTNPRKTVQFLWIAAAILLGLVAIHKLRGDSFQGFIYRSGAGAHRRSIREHMAWAEASWERSVKQRHETIEEDWGGDASKLPVYVSYRISSPIVEYLPLT